MLFTVSGQPFSTMFYVSVHFCDFIVVCTSFPCLSLSVSLPDLANKDVHNATFPARGRVCPASLRIQQHRRRRPASWLMERPGRATAASPQEPLTRSRPPISALWVSGVHP